MIPPRIRAPFARSFIDIVKTWLAVRRANKSLRKWQTYIEVNRRNGRPLTTAGSKPPVPRR